MPMWLQKGNHAPWWAVWGLNLDIPGYEPGALPVKLTARVAFYVNEKGEGVYSLSNLLFSYS